VTSRRVWDAFPFCGELDLLECRLMELDSAVYRHVLVEAPVTFQGNSKPLYYAENRDRFAPWKDKIIHVVADLSDCAGNWERDHASREAIWQGLDDFDPDDIFMLSDVDEIPRADACQAAPGHTITIRFHQVAVNLLDPHWWPGPVAMVGLPSGSMQQFRDQRSSPASQPLRDHRGWPAVAGWHFTWLGGPAAMRAKVHAFAHAEQAAYVDAHAETIYRERLDPSGGPGRLLVTEIDDTWPRYMQERLGPASWYWPGDS
jgi:hypothetical protein